ncbi:MBL fold metallo-hydrolase RNA specificity domain-containing protein [endosymbiont of Lamellibrachia barhami]|uniref:MBL fold metallo-hydrolase RNA specificity domain-containing protein n=1 Tax=endosymbiont of Lamellibrachia barhami TaxID=205975 RepID=UPI0015AA7F22|nr:MBL fold metallo-hydrolase [endosymbiont of Lamellibrachia barhami]
MDEFQIIHHGAVTGVTGSCHELFVGAGNSVLIDCGLFQGEEASPGGAHADQLEIDFDIRQVRALLVTHCHIDHVGRIPWLIGAGFDGPIYCSEPTAELLPLVLEDALRIGVTRNEGLIRRFLKRIKKRLKPLGYAQWAVVLQTSSGTSLKIRFQPAGHILGSAYIECQAKVAGEQKKIIFSGDLGAPYAPLLSAPKPPYSADLLVLESTYGNRLHEGRQERRNRLQAVVERCFANRGVILFPAFSIGRTQELLYELETIIHQCRGRKAGRNIDWDDVEVIVDSPLASEFTKVYRRLQPFWDREAKRRLMQGRHPLSFEQMTTIREHRDHLATVNYLQKTARPTIVLAASGMCSGGRIVNYLKALIGDSRTDVVFVGYQAAGTPGRAIQRYGPEGGYVFLDEKRYTIRAGVYTLGGYSAHADRDSLVRFVKGMRRPPAEVRLVHGDDEAKRVLKEALQEALPETKVEIP